MLDVESANTFVRGYCVRYTNFLSLSESDLRALLSLAMLRASNEILK